MVIVNTNWKLNCIGFGEIYLYPEDFLSCDTEEQIREKMKDSIETPYFNESNNIEVLNGSFDSLDEDDFKEFINEWKELKNESI
jgi:hypothetical protein